MRLQGKRVDVYWNLHKHCWSVRYKGKVVAHLDTVGLEDVQYIVQPAGRQRVLREGRKNVHAFARGRFSYFAEAVATYLDYECQLTTYNPYKYNTFVLTNNERPVQGGKYAVLKADRTVATIQPRCKARSDL